MVVVVGAVVVLVVVVLVTVVLVTLVVVVVCPAMRLFDGTHRMRLWPQSVRRFVCRSISTN
jgi:hypothetical protein